MSKEIDDLKKLSPDERINRLREIAKRDRDEIKEAQNLIKESETELEEGERSKKQIPIPQIKSVDVGSLFGKGTQEAQIFKTKRFEGSEKEGEIEEAVEEVSPKGDQLEQAVSAERPSLAAKVEAEKQYLTQLSRQPAETLYNRMKNIYGQVQESGYVSPAVMQEAVNISYAMQEKNADIKEGGYAAGEKVQNEIMASGSMLKMLKDRYKGK